MPSRSLFQTNRFANARKAPSLHPFTKMTTTTMFIPLLLLLLLVSSSSSDNMGRLSLQMTTTTFAFASALQAPHAIKSQTATTEEGILLAATNSNVSDSVSGVSSCNSAAACWDEVKAAVNALPARFGSACFTMEDANVLTAFAPLTYCANSPTTTLNTDMSIASATKWVAAVTIMTVVEKYPTQLNTSTYVGDILDWWPSRTQSPSDARSLITLQMLLSFTSALPEDNDCVGSTSYTTLTCGKKILSDSYTSGLTGTPGAIFRYGGSHMQIAALMAITVAKATGWADLVRTTLTPRLSGITGNFIFAPLANPQIAGGLYTSAANYLIFLRAYHRGELLSAASMVVMETDYTPSPAVTISASPIQSVTPTQDWHYASGHWLQCMKSSFSLCPELSTAATSGVLPARSSSPGRNGFHPGIDRQSKMIYIISNYLSTPTAYLFSISLLTNVYDALNKTAIFSREEAGVTTTTTLTATPSTTNAPATPTTAATEPTITSHSPDGRKWADYRLGATLVLLMLSAIVLA